MEKSGAIYWFQCRDPVCDEEYIAETSRTFGARFKEHLKETSLYTTTVAPLAILPHRIPSK